MVKIIFENQSITISQLPLRYISGLIFCTGVTLYRPAALLINRLVHLGHELDGHAQCHDPLLVMGNIIGEEFAPGLTQAVLSEYLG